jgi:hypothetical protein
VLIVDVGLRQHHAARGAGAAADVRDEFFNPT